MGLLGWDKGKRRLCSLKHSTSCSCWKKSIKRKTWALKKWDCMYFKDIKTSKHNKYVLIVCIILDDKMKDYKWTENLEIQWCISAAECT